MNVMNINNAMFCAAKPRVNWARNINNREYPVNTELKNKINSVKSKLEAEAKKVNANVTLAQRGDSLFINSGALTTRIENTSEKTSDSLRQAILDNIGMNNSMRNKKLTISGVI